MEFLLSPWTIGGAGVSIIAGFAAIWFFAPGIGAWLLGSKQGRVLLIAAIVIYGIAIFLSWIFAKGREKERLAAQARNLEILRARVKAGDDTREMSVDQRKEYLKSWSKK